MDRDSRNNPEGFRWYPGVYREASPDTASAHDSASATPYPVLPYIPTPIASARRKCRSSDESMSTRGRFGISNVLHRVGAPPLRPLPLQTSHLDDRIQKMDQMLYKRVIDEASSLLELHIPGIDFVNDSYSHSQVDLVVRSIPDAEDTGCVTIFVTSPWGDQSSVTWHRAVRAIKIWIDSHLDHLGMQDMDVHVEMMAQELAMPKHFAPVINRPDLDKDWENIKSSVRHVLDAFLVTKNNWTSISLFRYGPRPDPAENPPTLFVTVNYECPEIAWSPIRRSIAESLAGTTYDLHLHIEHDSSQLSTFPLKNFDMAAGSEMKDTLLLESPYQQMVHLGADICVSRYLVNEDDGSRSSPGMGTLGCFVEVKMKSTGKWEVFGLTNYHIVRPSIEGFRKSTKTPYLEPKEGTPLYTVDHEGFTPSNAPPLITMESPSRIKHNFTMSYIDMLIEQGYAHSRTGVALQEDRDAKKAFFDRQEHNLGRPWAASGFGFRTEDGALLDWALIKIEKRRVGKNSLPNGLEWKDGQPPPARLSGAPLRRVAPKHELPLHHARFKYGAATRGGTGSFSRHKSDVVCQEWKYMQEKTGRYSREAVFIGQSHSLFSGPGDSGSVVYTGEGRALGLVFRGIKSSSSESWTSRQRTPCTYASPLQDVFTHIVSFLSEGISDIRIAQL